MIGVAVAGTGHWGPNLARNFYEDPRSRLVRLVDRDAERVHRVAERYPGVPASTDFGDVVTDDAVHAVVIATATATHYPLARAAMEAGKHVFVEKPLATCVAEAEELCKLADANGVVLLVGHVFLYNEAIRQAKRYLVGGELGRLYYISMIRTNLGPIRVDVNAAWDLASHDVAIANWWLDAEPITVSAVGGWWINEGYEDAVFATLRYPQDVLVRLDVSWLNPRKVRDITVVGNKRMMTIDDMELTEPLRLYDKGVTDELIGGGLVDTFASFRASTREGDITIPRVSVGEPLKVECADFLDCIASGTRPISGGPEGLGVVRVIEAIDKSMGDRGREVPVVA